MISGFKLSLAGALAIGCALLFAACVYFKGDADATRRQVASLSLELAVRDVVDGADDRARTVASAGRDEVESLLREFLEANARDPVSETCRSDPAILRAYDAVERMQREHSDALRASAGRDSKALQTP